MKNECEIVRDLLFSYNDEVVSEFSKEFIERHLKTCESCSKVLEEIKGDTVKYNEKKEINYLKKIKNKITIKNRVIMISSFILIISIILNIIVFISYYSIASTMEIYLKNDISEENRKDIEQVIMQKGDKIELIYKSKEEHLSEMKGKFGESQNLLERYEGKNNIFPSSYIVKANPKIIREIQDSILSMTGIITVNSYIDENPYLVFIGQFIGQF